MSVLLEIAQLPRATFYYHRKRMHRTDKYAQAKTEISAIYHENKGRYGYRRITIALRSRGIYLNHKTVQRLMKQLRLVCHVRVKKYRSYKGNVGKVASNLLNRDFYAEKPNQKWVTDVTEFSLFGQKLYLSPILDLHNGYLVSYTISERPVLSMVTTMLDKAFAVIPDGTGLILHSDQGWQYQHKQYQRMLKAKGVRQSMSRKGNCLDNAVAENFFGLLKSELLYLQKFQSMQNFKQELIDYLDYYNNRRIKAKLKGLPPAIHNHWFFHSRRLRSNSWESRSCSHFSPASMAMKPASIKAEKRGTHQPARPPNQPNSQAEPPHRRVARIRNSTERPKNRP